MNKQRKTSHILNVFQYDETTGAVTLPSSLSLATPDSTDNSTKVATTAWIRAYVGSLSYATASSVTTAIANLVASAPTTLDTLNELATALGNDPNFATTITTSLGNKLSLTGGTLTGDLTLSGTNPRLYFTDTDNNPDYFISNTDGTFTVYDVTNSVGRFKIYTTGNAEFSNNLTALSFVKTGGTAAQFLKADGSVDSSTYLTGITSGQVTTALGYTPVPTTRTITINGTAYNLSADVSWTIASGVTSFNTRTGAIVLSSADVTGALGFTPYNATNPSGYISGITSLMVTNALGFTPYNATNPAGYITSSGSITGSAMSLNGFANQTEYTILNGPANGPVWKVRYDSATANRYVDLGFKDGNGVYTEGFKIYNGGTPTWAGSTIWHSGNLTNLNQLTNGPGYQTSAGSVNYANSAGAVAWTNVSGRPTVVSAFSNDAGYIGVNNQSYFGINNTSSTSGNGISLYGSYGGGTMNYGIMFAGTPTYGTHGAVSGDWATYFMMNDDTTRGWIFRRNGAANVASISGAGHFSTSGYMRVASNNNLYLDWNYGQSIVGVYSSTRYQGVFAMGDAYKLAIDGSSPGNLYGLAWSHPNAGGQAGYLNDHGLLVMVNGLTYASISSNIWARGSITANSHVYATNGYFYGSGSIRCGDMWGGAGLYRPSGDMVFGTEGYNWVFSSQANTRAYFNSSNGNLWMQWAGDWLSNLLGAKVNTSSVSGLSVNYANYAGYLPTAYAGGVQSNPQVYFNNGIGLKVAMTGYWSVWSDTVWVNGYSGGDVPWMCALHFLRNSEPRFAISAQTHGSGSYGSIYEVITSYNIANQTVSTANNLSGFDKTNPSFGAVYANNWFRAYGDSGLYSQDYGGYFRRNTNSYGTWESVGYAKNGWGGYVNNNNYIVSWMLNTSGDFGFLTQNGNWWNLFYNNGNNCWGIGTDNTYSGDGFRCIKYGSSQYGWTTWSDRRAKENISSITGALDKVLNMRGVYFNYISDEAKNKRVGFIAQELEQVLPEAVRYAEEIDEYNVEYAQIVSVLAEAIKEQNIKITRLEALVEQLTNN